MDGSKRRHHSVATASARGLDDSMSVFARFDEVLLRGDIEDELRKEIEDLRHRFELERNKRREEKAFFRDQIAALKNQLTDEDGQLIRQYAKWQNEDITLVQRLEEQLLESQQALSRSQENERQYKARADGLELELDRRKAERAAAERERDEARVRESAARKERDRVLSQYEETQKRLQAETEKGEGMKRVLEQVKREIDAVQRNMVKEREERAKMEKDLDEAIGRAREERKRRERAEQDLEAARTQFLSERSKLEKAQQELEEKAWELETAREEQEESRKRLNSMAESLEREKQIRVHAERTAQDKDREIRELQEKRRAAEHKLESQSSMLQKQAADLGEKEKKMKSKLLKALHEKDDQIQGLTSKWKHEIAEMQSRTRHLEEALQASETAVERLRQQNAALVQEASEWRQQAAQDAAVAKRQGELLKERDSALADVEAVLQRAELDMKHKDEALANVQARLRQAEASLREKDDLLGEVEERLAHFEETRESLREELQEKRGALAAAEQEHSQLRADLEKKDKSLAKANRQLNLLENEIEQIRHSAEDEVARRVNEAKEKDRAAWEDKLKRAEAAILVEKDNTHKIQMLMQEMERNCKKLSEKQIELLEEIERLRGPFVRADDENGDSKNHVSVAELKRTKQELTEQVARLQKQIEQEQERSQGLEAIIYKYQQDGETTRSNIQMMLSEVERMKKQRNEEHAKLVSVELELDNAKKELLKYQTATPPMKAPVDDTNDDHGNGERNGEHGPPDADEVVSRLRAELDEVRAAKEEALQRVEEQLQEIEDLRHELASIGEYSREESTLEAERQAAREKAHQEELDRLRTDAEAERMQLEEALAAEQSKTEVVERQLTELQEEAEGLREALAKTEDDADEVRAQLANIQAELAAKADEVEQLRRELEARTKELERMETESIHLEEEATNSENLKTELAEKEEEVTRLKHDMQQKDADIGRLREDIEALQSERAREREQHQHELQAVEADLESFKATVTRTQAEKDALEREFQGKLDELQSMLSAKERTWQETLDARTKEFDAAITAKENEWKATIVELDEVLRQREEQFSSRENELRALLSEKEEVIERLNERCSAALVQPGANEAATSVEVPSADGVATVTQETSVSEPQVHEDGQPAQSSPGDDDLTERLTALQQEKESIQAQLEQERQRVINLRNHCETLEQRVKQEMWKFSRVNLEVQDLYKEQQAWEARQAEWQKKEAEWKQKQDAWQELNTMRQREKEVVHTLLTRKDHEIAQLRQTLHDLRHHLQKMDKEGENEDEDEDEEEEEEEEGEEDEEAENEDGDENEEDGEEESEEEDDSTPKRAAEKASQKDKPHTAAKEKDDGDGEEESKVKDSDEMLRLQAEVSALRAELAQAEAEKGVLRRKLEADFASAREKEWEKVTKRIEAWERRAAKLDSSLRESEAARAQLDSELGEARAALAEANRRVEELQQEIEALRASSSSAVKQEDDSDVAPSPQDEPQANGHLPDEAAQEAGEPVVDTPTGELEDAIPEDADARDDDGDDQLQEEDFGALAAEWDFHSTTATEPMSPIANGQEDGVPQQNGIHVENGEVDDDEEEDDDEDLIDEAEKAGLTPEGLALVRRERQLRKRTEREFGHFRDQSLADLDALRQVLVGLTLGVDDDRAAAKRLKRRNWILQKKLEHAERELARVESERAALADGQLPRDDSEQLQKQSTETLASDDPTRTAASEVLLECERRAREPVEARERELRRMAETMEGELQRFKQDLARMMQLVERKKQRAARRKIAAHPEEALLPSSSPGSSSSSLVVTL